MIRNGAESASISVWQRRNASVAYYEQPLAAGIAQVTAAQGFASGQAKYGTCLPGVSGSPAPTRRDASVRSPFAFVETTPGPLSR